MTGKIFILLGSNLGNRLSNLRTARGLISREIGHIVTLSSFYQTAPWGNKDQPEFVNQVLEIESDLSPEELLQTCLAIEESLGRIRIQKWAARTIDIDILFYSTLVKNNADLTIPHPEIQNRRFTLVPLHEICPEFLHPVLNKTINQLLNECKDDSLVIKMKATGS